MARKEPERWAEPLTPTPVPLTKKDIFDYYNIPEIQKALLRATRNRDVAILQSFSPEKQVFRRHGAGKTPIRFNAPEDFRKWQAIRMSEVHPVFGEKENILLADIDPGPDVSWERTKELARAVAAQFAAQPDVSRASLQFSGGRGFHVRGHLRDPVDIDTARKQSQEALAKIITEHADTTLGQRTGPEQVRLDVSPLHATGSLRAPYSLNVQTGLASAPVSLRELGELVPEQFTPVRMIDRILKQSAAEFAPGIPKSRRTRPIPAVKTPTSWDMVVQLHKAEKAGPHWDLRLIDPKNRAHSFVVPQQRFPGVHDRMLLALQMPTHGGGYARHFEGTIPRGTYGAGTVSKELQESVNILSSDKNRIRFARPDGSVYSLFRTAGNKWGFKQSPEKV